MNHEHIESSMIKSVAYFSENQTLEVIFQNESIYQCVGISADLYQQLLEAPSKGQFMNQYIIGTYEYTRKK
jgi:hypothetical protein